MKVTLKNIGTIEQAYFDLDKDLTVFIEFKYFELGMVQHIN